MKRYRYFKTDLLSFDTIEIPNYKPYIIISLIVNIVLISTIIIQSFTEPTIITKVRNQIIERYTDDVPLTDSAIVHELTAMGCILPSVALAQMKLETGHFTSKICRQNKNIAGIRNSTSKFVIRMLNGHCAYSTYRDCLRDYVRIQNRYLAKIDGKYAEDPKYIESLKSIK